MIVGVLLGAGGASKPLKKACDEILTDFETSYLSCRDVSLNAYDAAVFLASKLEDCPATNAGTGSELNQNGQAECDALLIVGPRKRGASVAAVKNVKNPVRICHRMLADSSPRGLSAPRFLAGEGATEYAKLNELELSSLTTDRSIAAYKHWTTKHHITDTIGVFAYDGNQWAVASSSGGSLLKFPGRVGPAAVIGAAADLSSEGAAIASGFGEDILEFGLSRQSLSTDMLEDLPNAMKEHELQRPPYFGIVRALQDEKFIYIDYFHTTESMTFGVFDASTKEKRVIYSEYTPSSSTCTGGTGGGWKLAKPMAPERT